MTNPLKLSRFAWIAAILGVLVGGIPSPPVNAEEGFEDLFDGKTLAGWHKNPEAIGHGTGGSWTVEDDAITGEQDPPGSGNGGILLTDREFGDFELLIDMRPDWGICSGLYLRGNDLGQCFQMTVDYHDAGNIGHIYGEGTGGFNNRTFEIFGKPSEGTVEELFTKPAPETPPKAYSVSGEDWVKVWKVNDWNTARVKMVGNPPHITTWINGVKCTEFDGSTYKGENYDRDGVTKALGDAGSIAVQVHGGDGWPKGAKCRFKNIKVKPL